MLAALQHIASRTVDFSKDNALTCGLQYTSTGTSMVRIHWCYQCWPTSIDLGACIVSSIWFDMFYCLLCFHVIRGIQSWFSQVVLEWFWSWFWAVVFVVVALKTSGWFSPGFHLVFTLVFTAHSWTLNSLCHHTASPNSTTIPCLKYIKIILIQSLLHSLVYWTSPGTPKR